jgi:hypothetical protein
MDVAVLHVKPNSVLPYSVFLHSPLPSARSGCLTSSYSERSKPAYELMILLYCTIRIKSMKKLTLMEFSAATMYAIPLSDLVQELN